jgi:hypothetical protein
MSSVLMHPDDHMAEELKPPSGMPFKLFIDDTWFAKRGMVSGCYG